MVARSAETATSVRGQRAAYVRHVVRSELEHRYGDERRDVVRARDDEIAYRALHTRAHEPARVVGCGETRRELSPGQPDRRLGRQIGTEGSDVHAVQANAHLGREGPDA